MTLTMFWLIAAALCALAAIACEERAAGRHAAFYVLKPLTTLLILGAAWTAPGADPQYRLLIVAGLLLSTCGDAALTRSGNVAFLAGLGSFLLAHLLFVAAFALQGFNAPPPWIALPLVVALAFFAWLLPRTGPLRVPVLVYGATIVAMCAMAAARHDARGDVSGLLAVIGALVFMASDSALAVRQFHGAYPRAQLLILSTYWVAVGLIAASVIGSVK